MGRTYDKKSAELEADRIGMKFMNSNDVMADMERAYNVDFSDVRIHTDDSAERRAHSMGKDAVAEGRDIFFGKGIFESSDPASKGFVAHELAHTMQQGVVGDGMVSGVQESVPEGVPQGGKIWDWFKRTFGFGNQAAPEPAPAPEPATPEPAPTPTTNPDEIQISDPVLQTGPVTQYYQAKTGDQKKVDFMNFNSSSINEMVRAASREQLHNPFFQKLIIDDYNKSMNARLRDLQARNVTVEEMDGVAFRKSAGELNSLNTLLASYLPENFIDQVLEAHNTGGDDGAMDLISDTVSGNQNLMDIFAAISPSYEGITRYNDADISSSLMMNNLLLRTVNNVAGERQGMAYRTEYARLRSQIKKEHLSEEEKDRIHSLASQAAPKTDIMKAQSIQRASVKSNSASASRFRKLLSGLFSRA